MSLPVIPTTVVGSYSMPGWLERLKTEYFARRISRHELDEIYDAASKAAIVRLVECLADEVRDHNVQVNCMAPGPTYSHMTDEILHAGEELAGLREIEEAERVRVTGGVLPEKQVQLALFLASDRSNHISGKLIHVNDDWKRLEQENMRAEMFTLRRVQKI